jgi:hypothetical protein
MHQLQRRCPSSSWSSSESGVLESWSDSRIPQLISSARNDRDNKINQRLVVKQLKRAGYIVTTLVKAGPGTH